MRFVSYAFHLMIVGVACVATATETKKVSVRGARDTIQIEKSPVVVEGNTIPVRTVIPSLDGVRIIASKKAESLQLTPADANLALNNTRQAFSRVAGVMVWENDGTGVQAGVAVRGLSPNRSWEFNTRMDGVDIAADIAGYPEAYFTPAFESLERIEIIRGAATLQYGPQFGGLLNYVTKSAPAGKAFGVESSQLGGQNGYYSTYTAIGGDHGSWSYYVFASYRRADGWRLPVRLRDGSERESDRWWQYSVMPKVQWRPSENTSITLEAAFMQYRLQQPGGLDSAQFALDSRQAMRYRDWFNVPWFVPVVHISHRLSDRALVDAKLFGVVGARESIGLITNPTIPDTGTNPRRVNTDNYRNVGVEVRGRYDVALGAVEHPLAVGLRLFRGSTIRRQGRGPDGDGFSTAFVRTLTRDLDFTTLNAAAFAEWNVQLHPTLSVTPGVRLEWLDMRGTGTYSREKPATSPDAFDTLGTLQRFDKGATETLPLAGIGVLWRAFEGIELYGNAYQSWRPAQFSELFPNDPSIAVDPALRSSRGVSTDVGLRGTIAAVVSFDISGFYLYYGDRIGTVARAALGADTVLLTPGASQLRRNLGASEHRGVELYTEVFLSSLLPLGEHGASLFATAAYTDARYTAGPTAGKRVEYAPEWIVRGGVRYQWKQHVAISLQGSSVSECFSDASNTRSSASGINGVIPAYTVWDLSAQVQLTEWLRAELNVNNIFDRRYFTRRAGGYPGPGIIPADGRIITGGLRFVL
ncbi:MAG: TonB-dependent receptor [Bacteroidota bacterium]|nr:TonB-dependent receptor [Bacteroidota bacterium]